MGSWHPQITHFPIALIISAFFFQIVAMLKSSWVCRSTPLWILGFAIVPALFSLLSGEQAAHLASTTRSLEDSAQALLARHDAFATFTVWMSLAVLVSWVWFFLKYPGDRRVDTAALFFLFLLALAVAATGYLGGELVLTYGVGVKM
ncbi:MAG: DUF2231 domain-containing protein [Candidatus Neomarinimicrobiota bacterium]